MVTEPGARIDSCASQEHRVPNPPVRHAAVVRAAVATRPPHLRQKSRSSPDSETSKTLAPPVKVNTGFVVLRNRPLLVAIAGYCGHMWEVFGLWALAATALTAQWGLPHGAATSLAGVAIATGGGGSLVGGWLGRRHGRARVAAGAMAASACCGLALALETGLLGLSDRASVAARAAAAALCVCWGATVLADSPQFPVIITRHADPRSVGTALSVQLGCGCLIVAIDKMILQS
jgi:hypothetical protein